VSEAKPFSKQAQLERGPKRTPRGKATSDEWRAIIAAKGRMCRLRGVSPCDGATEYHHLLSRARLGDDVPENIVPLCRHHHLCVTSELPRALRRLAERLSDAEYAYVIHKLGEGALERLFGGSL
jgi:hypothetical protein